MTRGRADFCRAHAGELYWAPVQQLLLWERGLVFHQQKELLHRRRREWDPLRDVVEHRESLGHPVGINHLARNMERRPLLRGIRQMLCLSKGNV